MKEKQQRLLGQRSSSSASMVQQNLAGVSQQQQVFTPPRLKTKYKNQQSPESQ